MEWFNGLAPSLKVFSCVAIITSLIFLFQSMVYRVDRKVEAKNNTSSKQPSNMAVEKPGGAAAVFTLRNLTIFLIGYGWSGVILFEQIGSGLVLNISALMLGLIFSWCSYFFSKRNSRKVNG